MALISSDISDLIKKFKKITVDSGDKPQGWSNQDDAYFCFEKVLEAINTVNNQKKIVKTIKCKSFTKKKVTWKILLFDNADITCSCPSFKYSKFNKCKHIKKIS